MLQRISILASYETVQLRKNKVVTILSKNCIIYCDVPKTRQSTEKKKETFEINHCAANYLQIVLYSSEKDSARNKKWAIIHAVRCDQGKEI